MRKLKTLLMVYLAVLLVLPLAACGRDEGPAEEAGRKIDETVEEAREKVEEVGEEMEEAAEEAGEKVEEAGEAMQE